MKRTFIFSFLTLALMMVCQSAFAYDYYVNGIYYRKVTQQLPGGGCGETYAHRMIFMLKRLQS